MCACKTNAQPITYFARVSVNRTMNLEQDDANIADKEKCK
jgi:hypothetical protein